MVANTETLPNLGPAVTGPNGRTPETALGSNRAGGIPAQIPAEPRVANETVTKLAAPADLAPQDSKAMSKQDLDKALAQKPEASEVKGVPVLWRDTVPMIATGIASAMHLLTAFGRIFKNILPASAQTWLENNVLKLSKTANAFNYTMKSADSFMHKRGFDALGRFMHVLFVPGASLEDIFLAGGMSSGPTNMMLGVDRKKSDKPKSAWEDITYHLRYSAQMFKEILQAGFGKKRLVLKPEWDPKTKQLKEERHTLFFAGVLNIVFAALGLGAKLFKLPEFLYSPIRKIAALGRNFGSFASDYGKLSHPDIAVKTTGWLYVVVAALDILQSFISNKYLRTTLNHFLQPITNVANFIYTLVSAKKNDGKLSEYGKSDKYDYNIEPIPELKRASVNKAAPAPAADTSNELAFAE